MNLSANHGHKSIVEHNVITLDLGV